MLILPNHLLNEVKLDNCLKQWLDLSWNGGWNLIWRKKIVIFHVDIKQSHTGSIPLEGSRKLRLWWLTTTANLILQAPLAGCQKPAQERVNRGYSNSCRCLKQLHLQNTSLKGCILQLSGLWLGLEYSGREFLEPDRAIANLIEISNIEVYANQGHHVQYL